MNHAARSHALFSWSAASRWFACPGSIGLIASLPPRPPGKWAAEGTRAHELLEVQLRKLLGRASNMDVELVLGGIPKDEYEDTIRSVNVCVDYVRQLLDEYPTCTVLLEQKFLVPSEIAPGDVGGTADIIIHVPPMRLLIVVDFKHGSGVFVPIEGNKQLRGYAWGALSSLPSGVKVDTICMAIVQPRIAYADPVREEWITADELRDFTAETEAAVKAALAPDPPLIPGAVQCQFCPATPVCPAREKMALEAIGAQFSDIKMVAKERLPKPDDLTPQRIADILQLRDLVEDWFRTVYERALMLAREGTEIPGRKVVEARPKRVFTGDESRIAHELAEIGRKYSGRDVTDQDFFVTSLMGITKVEEVMKALFHSGTGPGRGTLKSMLAEVSALTETKSSGTLSLVPLSDKRPAVADSSVRGTVLEQLRESAALTAPSTGQT